MLRRGSVPVLIAVLLISALVIPESRRMLAMQVRCSALGVRCPGAVPHGTHLLPESLLGALERSDVHVSPGWQGELALAHLRKSCGSTQPAAVDHSRRALEGAPDRPEAYAAAIENHIAQSTFTRPELDSFRSPKYHPHVRRADPRTMQALLTLAAEGSRLAPDNAFFDLVSAYAMCGLYRDREALAFIHSAAGKPRYDSYNTEARKAISSYLLAAGLPKMEAYASQTLVSSDHSYAFRTMLPVSMASAKLLDRSGDRVLAEGRLIDLLKVSALIRKDSVSIVDNEIANDMRSAVWETIRLSPRSDRGWISCNKALRRWGAIGADAFNRHGWTSLASVFSQATEADKGLADACLLYESDTANPMVRMQAAADLTDASARIAMWAVVMLALGGLLWLAIRVDRTKPDSSSADTGPGRAGSVPLVLGSLAAMCLALFGQTAIPLRVSAMGSGSEFSPSPELTVVLWGVSSVMTLAVAVSLIGRMARSARGLRALLLCLGLAVLLVLSVFPLPTGFDASGEARLAWVVMGSSILRLVVALFVLGRLAIVHRGLGVMPSLRMSMCIAQRGVLLAGQVLVVGVLLVHLAQIPIRQSITAGLQDRMQNEVGAVLRAQECKTTGS